MSKKNVAIVFYGLHDDQFGGAERFFADVYDKYNALPLTKYNLYFITDKKSFDIYRKLGKLRQSENIILLQTVSNRFKKHLENIDFVLKLLSNKINLIHIGNYDRQYYDRVSFISKLPAFLKPKIIINIVDCMMPYSYKELPENSYYKRYGQLFKKTSIDGIYTWYKLFKEFAEENNIIRSKPYIECANVIFADLSRFYANSEKRNEIVFAARLIHDKHPMMFLQAIAILKEGHFDLKNWKFSIYGSGPLEGEISEYIKGKNLTDLVSLAFHSDLSKVFPYTKCFVSTQDYENFSSLSMCEAMAAGNAIITRNVGQTNYFVKNGINGVLTKEDTAKGLAEAIIFFIEHPELHASMMKESVRLATQVHTAENFIKDIEEFWSKFVK